MVVVRNLHIDTWVCPPCEQKTMAYCHVNSDVWLGGVDGSGNISSRSVGPGHCSALYHVCDCDPLLLPVRPLNVGGIPGLGRVRVSDPLSAYQRAVAGGRSTRLLFSISLHLHRPV